MKAGAGAIDAAEPVACPTTVALLPWGNVIEDFLDAIGVSLEAFCSRMSGGWLFGYTEALQRAGCRVVIICVSARVEQVTRRCHLPTGASVVVLPASRAYRVLRRQLADPYGWTIEQVVGRPSGRRRRTQARAARDLCFYVATPVRLLARELRRMRCDAILCQEYEYARFDISVALGELLRLPVFATFQGGNWQMSRLERWFRGPAIRASAGVIVPTSTEAERIISRYRLPAARVARIFNPLDVELWSPVERDRARAALGIPPEARVAIWHGRVDLYRKGLDLLLDAWRRLVPDPSAADFRLFLIGTGADAPALQQRLRDLPRVTWRNEYVLDRTVVRSYLSAADLYVLPSRHEGFPVAPLEAMACGLPVVATDAPGIPDILEGGAAHGGVVVPRGDVAALAGGLRTMLESPGRMRELGAAARSRAAASFSLESVGEQLATTLFPTRIAAAGARSGMADCEAIDS